MAQSPAVSFVLAAVLLFAILSPLTPQADAATTNDLRIATGPFFAAKPAKDGASSVVEHMVAIRPDVTTAQVRVLEIFNPRPVIVDPDPAVADNNDITQIVLSYTLAADPGTADAPGLSHAFRWDNVASATPGWTVTASNTANTAGESRTLTFTASGTRIGPQTTARINVAIFANPDSVGATPDPTKQERYPVKVSATSEIGDVMNTADPVAFRIVVDNTAPDLLGAYTRDQNYDGKLDRIQLDFSEPMDPATFLRQDFTVRDNSVTPAVDYTVIGIETPKLGRVAFTVSGVFTLLHEGGPTGAGATLPTNPTPIDGEKTAFLVLSPLGRYDTGVVPDVTYDAPGVAQANFNLMDLAGHKLRRTLETNAAITEVDGAKPVLVGASSVVGSTTVTLLFSEPVKGTAGDNRIHHPDLDYFDFAGGSPNNAPAITAFQDPLTHVASQDQGRVAKLVRVSGGTMGAGDICPFPGANCDRVAMKEIAPAPTTCTAPDFAPCSARIQQISGGLRAVMLGGGFTPQSVLAPRVALKAQVNNDANKVTIDFTVPVSAAASDSVAVPLSAFDVVAADGTGEGPAGVVLAQQVDGKQVILTLDKKTRPTDLDDTPARIRIRCETIRVTGLADTFIPCADPDGDGRPDIDIEDRTRPAIREVRTVDGNRNGYLDGLFLIMNEPVDDASFCISLLPTPGGGPPAKTFQIPASCDRTNPDVVLDIQNVCGPYTWETNVEGIAEEALVGLDIPRDRDNQKNDRYGIIKFPEANTCGGLANPLPTDRIPRITTRSEGLFADLSQFTPVNNVRKMVPICEGKAENSQNCARWTDADTVNFVCPVGAPSTCPEDPPELDKAPPIIWSATTVDSHTADKLEGNGLIDGYKLTFSEPVDDDSFLASDWFIDGHNATHLATADKHIVDTSARVNLCGITQSYRNDCQVIVHFDEAGRGRAPDGDTDQTPQLTYRHPGGVGGFRDLNGNDMLPVDANTVNERDGSRPVIFRAEGQPLKSKIRVTFSEPVDNGARGGLVRGDFTYSNANQRDVVGMADQQAIAHVAGERSALIVMTGPMSQSDLDNDCIAADLNAVLEVAPNLPVASRQWASVACHTFATGSDLEPPGAVQGLAIVSSLTTANSVTLTFTAPGDDGLDFGTVDAYQVRVSRGNINNLTVHQTVNVTRSGEVLLKTNAPKIPVNSPIFLEAKPAELVSNGGTQQLQIYGLDPETRYNFTVIALDEVRLQSPLSSMVSATTIKDITPPGVPVPYTSVPRGGTSAQRTITFEWDAVEDPESTVTYRYTLNKLAESTPKNTDNATAATSITFPNLPAGTYVFHVLAVSGGGTSAAAHYPFSIGYTTVPEAALKLATGRVKTTPERLEGVNTVNWELPSDKSLIELQTGMKFEGIRIMRLDGNSIVEIHRVKGTYDSLARGSFDDPAGTDKSAYRVEVIFADGQTLSDQSFDPKFSRVVDITPDTFELTGLLVSLAVLLVAALVVGIVLYLRRTAATAGPSVLEAPPAGVDATTGMPTHDVECPNCKTPFQAVGVLPLQIHCPKCGVTGVLQ